MLRRTAFVLIGLVLIASSCTGDPSNEGNGSDGGDTGSTGGLASAGTPADTLVIAEGATPTSLDSEFVGNTPQNLEAGLNYADPLVSLPTVTNSDGTVNVDPTAPPVPMLAESYERSEDGLTYTFKLREGVLSFFGNELTSADVAYLFERSLAIEGLCGGFVLGISSVDKENPVTIHDDYNFDINLLAPNPVLPLAIATIPICTIYDSTEVKSHATADDPYAKDWLATHTASFGAYHVETFIPGEETVWVANPNYFLGPPAFERILVRAVPESSSRATLLAQGEIDIAADLTPRQREEVRGTDGIVIESRTGTAGLILGLNNSKPPLDDQLVRQAVAYALPMDDIISSVFLGQAGVQVAPGYIPVDYPGTLDSWPYERDVERARALLQEAGVSEPTLQLSYNTSQSVDEEVATLIQTGLREAGIEVVLQQLSPAKYFEQYFSREAQMVLVNDAPFVPDGPYVLGLYFHPDPAKSPANWVNFDDPQVSELIDAGLASADPQERDSLARQANEILVEQAPWGFYLHVGNHLPRWENVTGYVWQTNNFLRFADFAKS